MSNATPRKTASRDRDSVETRLARVLETPHLARIVLLLAPETLHRLVRHRGLEACGELVTAATPAQLMGLLDLDLWRSAGPGADECFDVDRFAEWLEVLVEVGDEVAARAVAGLDESLVIAGLSRFVRVFDPGTFEPVAQSDDEAMDRSDLMRSEGATDGLECEVGGYLVRARTGDAGAAWDAIVALLVALDAEYPETFHALLRGCRRLSNSRAEVDGLDDLLVASEQHLYDVAGEREQRRSRLGYATPADARAFLALARQPRPPHEGGNPIAAAYFRAIDEEEEEAARRAPPVAPPAPRPDSAGDRLRPTADANELDALRPLGAATEEAEVSAALDATLEVLIEAGVMPRPPRALLGAGENADTAKVALLRRGMEFVLRHHEPVYVRRSRELAFLANVLTAGCTLHSRPFTPQEASDAAASICNLGLESWSRHRGHADRGVDLRTVPDTDAPADRHADPERGLNTAFGPEDLPDAFLVDHDLLAAFEVGWSVLYRDVSLFVADRLLAILGDLPGSDAETRQGLRRFERELARQRAAGTPWRARAFADVLATIDRVAWRGVVGLMAECPILPAARPAEPAGRTTSVDVSAFAFISTTVQLADVRATLELLPGRLSR